MPLEHTQTEHYLRCIRSRLERLYGENPNDYLLRKHISDECDWIEEQLKLDKDHRLMPMEDIQDLTDVVRVLEIEESFETPADAVRAIQAEVQQLSGFTDWVETWVSNSAGSYSSDALDGLFGMARDRIAALRGHR